MLDLVCRPSERLPKLRLLSLPTSYAGGRPFNIESGREEFYNTHLVYVYGVRPCNYLGDRLIYLS